MNHNKHKSKIQTIILLGLVLFTEVVIPVSAYNNTSIPLIPDVGAGWRSIGGNAQQGIIQIINIVAAILVIVGLVATLWGGIEYLLGQRDHDAHRADDGYGRFLKGLKTIAICFIAYGAIIYLFFS